MSSRQKSFFDQNHTRKASPSTSTGSNIPKSDSNQYHGSWQSSRNYGSDRNREDDARAQQQPPKPPIAASTQAKTKLHAFRLGAQAPGSPTRSPGKENDFVATTHSPSRKPPTIMVEQAYVPPSTPAVRLPLADLLGNTEHEARQGLYKEESPEEQLAWLPADGNAGSPAPRRKRAYSSSPATSSQTEQSAAKNTRRRLDTDQLHKKLATPKADPAADLWSKYSGFIAQGATNGARPPSLAHLLSDVSPQTLPRTPGGSVGGLRRWASCGTEFPESEAKRRKTQATAERFIQRDDQPFAAHGVSRLGAMVDQLRADLSRPRPREPLLEPSSSSPIPVKGRLDRPIDASPLGKPVKQEALKVPTCEHYSNAEPNTQSSDYGDDLDFAELVVNEAVDLQPNRPSNEKQHQSDDLTRNDNNLSTSNEQNIQLPTIVENEEDDDEFGADDDFTAEDLDTAMTQFDGASASNVQSSNLGNKSVVQNPDTEHNISFSSDDDEFGGLDVDDEQFAAVELAVTQVNNATAPSQRDFPLPKSRTIQRYLVKQVVTGKYLGDRGFEQEKVLLVEDEKAKTAKAITLRQSWLDTHCQPGAYVHVVGQFSRTGQITIDDADNLLIVHPDHLVSATAVADSFDCLRKAVLQDRVKATNATSKATVYGSILHELFQVALRHNRWDLEWLQERLGELVVNFIEGLFEAGAKNTVEAVEYTRSMLPGLKEWAKHFLRTTPSPYGKAQDRNGKTVSLSVSKLLDVEEHVWSPTYGLKGNIDATVEIAMLDDQGLRNLTVPFELKTGRYRSESHRAQTALYTLLLSDRYDVNVQYGILYYMENSEIIRIPAIRNELRHMVMQRNELASYVRERLSLPPMLRNEHKCGRCYARTSCFLYHKLSENGTAESAGVGTKFSEVVKKLKPIHQEFFKKWDDLLTKEETEMFKFRRELWTMLSHERQKLGRCFAEVVIEPGTAFEDQDAQKINRFAYTFLKKDLVAGFSFTESQITVGEPIVVSSEQGHFALANGYVTRVTPSRISVAVDRRLHNARTRQQGFDETKNQTFEAIMEVGKETTKGKSQQRELGTSEVVYRLDKDEFSNGMATVRNNLLAVMDDNAYRSYDLRELIIQDRAPVFKPSPSAYTLSGPPSQMQINSDQRAAIDKIMSAQDYALVLGMPGTGKTTTIAHIIRALVARGKSVLLTSYTHTAVDNILLKLRHSSISVLRLGVLAKIHPEVQEFANLAALPRQSIEELEELYMTPQVVATTCLGVNHQIFQKRVFDYCIVDEASQITLPVCLGPIRMARTFVLVGDHFQLPPLVQNKEAQEGGLDVSLFKLLSDRQPSSVVNLEHQYRMCAEIMHLSSTLIYSGRLKCGNDEVANRQMASLDPSQLVSFHLPSSSATNICPSPSSPSCQLSQILSSARKVVFVNTDPISSATETLVGSRIHNPYEAAVINLLASALLNVLPAANLGIITFYRSQLALLRQTLGAHQGVEMHTADKFQGRDKEVVLLSCARSNAASSVGELLRDWRRVNVAITRARSKFVLVGSRRTLEGDGLWKKLIALVEEMGGVVDLREGFVEGHCVPGGVVGESSGAEQPEARREVLSQGKSSGNRMPVKKGRGAGEALLKKRLVSRDIMNMILE